MNYKKYEENPFQIRISFHKVIESLQEIALSDGNYQSAYAEALLKKAAPYPELSDGISIEKINEYTPIIKSLLANLFPQVLTNNEIKAVTIPFQNVTLNYSERFSKIIKDAGENFDIIIRDFTEHQFYIMSCCLILNNYYGYHFDLSRPLFYDIPDADGVVKHYRILYNADFLEIYPTEKAVEITPEDVELLMDSYDNLSLWKEKFPNESWISKGFGIVTLFDVTTENAVSNLKTNLLTADVNSRNLTSDFETIFSSIFRISDLKVGFTAFNQEEGIFNIASFNEVIHSYILQDVLEAKCKSILCNCSFDTLMKDKKYLAISDVQTYLASTDDSLLAKHLLEQGVQSCIFAPVVKNDRLMGVIELVSSKKGVLNSLNATKMDIVMPYIVDTMERYYSDLQNQIEAIIQNEYTSIHPSVYWKFRKEAIQYINTIRQVKDYTPNEIVFPEVYALFGQIDIKGSSEIRNASVQKDLIIQMNSLIEIFNQINKESRLPIFEQKTFEIKQSLEQLKTEFRADTEQSIQNYISTNINPIVFSFQSKNKTTRALIKAYADRLDKKTETIYEDRKNFDITLSVINKKMANMLDEKQLAAQQYYPHYYERFKTDGVEHNLYIGASITGGETFDLLYLHNLRLWQLQVMCEMENEYQYLRETLPYKLDVASLILVFSTPISIRFRMDEKRFDVDGNYNARYEIVKKRIDKANVKGIEERITQKEKITIVFFNKKEEQEYLRYIEFLQSKNILGKEIETFDVEDLQGVSGLKAIRVPITYKKREKNQITFSYEDLLKELSI